jgi:hypothetical protein
MDATDYKSFVDWVRKHRGKEIDVLILTKDIAKWCKTWNFNESSFYHGLIRSGLLTPSAADTYIIER